jgi:hypothetical protein
MCICGRIVYIHSDSDKSLQKKWQCRHWVRARHIRVETEMTEMTEMTEVSLYDPIHVEDICIFDSQIRCALAQWPASRITTTTTIYKLRGFDADVAADVIGEDCDGHSQESDKYIMSSLDGASVDVFNKMKNCITFKWAGCAAKVFKNGSVHVTGPRTIAHALHRVECIADRFGCHRPSTVSVCLCNILLPPSPQTPIDFASIRRRAPRNWLISVNNERFSGMRIKFVNRSGTILVSRRKNITLAGFDDIASMCEVMYELKTMA